MDSVRDLHSNSLIFLSSIKDDYSFHFNTIKVDLRSDSKPRGQLQNSQNCIQYTQVTLEEKK
jgi:hypothetical protein